MAALDRYSYNQLSATDRASPNAVALRHRYFKSRYRPLRTYQRSFTSCSRKRSAIEQSGVLGALTMLARRAQSAIARVHRLSATPTTNDHFSEKRIPINSAYRLGHDRRFVHERPALLPDLANRDNAFAQF